MDKENNAWKIHHLGYKLLCHTASIVVTWENDCPIRAVFTLSAQHSHAQTFQASERQEKDLDLKKHLDLCVGNNSHRKYNWALK